MVPWRRPAALCVVIALIAAACSAAEVQNAPLAAGQANPERRSLAPDDPDRPAILLTFSGGGSRAAALAADVLADLAATTYTVGSRTYPLTGDVRLISSVSGGSVTAAWFGLRRDAAHPDGDLAGLRDRFLRRDNMAQLGWDALNPITWFRLAFTSYTRIDALEAMFDQTLFDNATMSALNQPGKPIVMLNTTDMAGGQGFALAPWRMDDVCSQFDSVKVSTGVAASAAVPIVLSPVAFRDYSPTAPDRCPGQVRSDVWARHDLENPNARYLALGEYRNAQYTYDLRRGENRFRDIQYLYFLDGGLADNLGINALRTTLLQPYNGLGFLYALNTGKFKKLVVIVVNARADPPNAIYQQTSVPGLVSAINAVTSVPIDANTTNSQASMTELLTEIAQFADVPGSKATDLRLYGVTVDFDQLPADTPEHRKLRDEVKSVPTTWTLTDRQLAQIQEAAHLLLRSDPCYAALVHDLPIQAVPGPIGSSTQCATRLLTK